LAAKSNRLTGELETTPSPTLGHRVRKLAKRTRPVLVFMLVALLVLVPVRIFIFRGFFVPSASMTQTLEIDDHLVVNEFKSRFIGVDRGEIVVFKDPGGWLGEADSSFRFDPVGAVADIFTGAAFAKPKPQFLVKRVIGIAGDHIVCSNACKHLQVNGKTIVEPYLSQASANASDEPFDVVVPAGELWVMGDNRVGSADSRYHQDLPSHGFLPVSDVTGVVAGISWPLNRIGWISDDGHRAFSALDSHPATNQ
jgi:signal peptidase I